MTPWSEIFKFLCDYLPQIKAIFKNAFSRQSEAQIDKFSEKLSNYDKSATFRRIRNILVPSLRSILKLFFIETLSPSSSLPPDKRES